jgi:hypothetical protein
MILAESVAQIPDETALAQTVLMPDIKIKAHFIELAPHREPATERLVGLRITNETRGFRSPIKSGRRVNPVTQRQGISTSGVFSTNLWACFTPAL